VNGDERSVQAAIRELIEERKAAAHLADPSEVVRIDGELEALGVRVAPEMGTE
jgi:hypothetical protein